VSAATGSAVPLYVYDMVSGSDGPVAVGAGRTGTTVDAGVWQLHLQLS
jgi:hypothetical protein